MASSTVKFLLFCLMCIGVYRITPVCAQFSSIGSGVNIDVSSTAISNFGSSIQCRSSQDILKKENITAHAGDDACAVSAVTCINQKLEACGKSLSGNSEVVSALKDCGTNLQDLSTCILPVLAKHCDTSACSSCPSSVNAAFDNKCTSGGGQLCRQTALFLRHRIQAQSVCAPSVCSSQLLTTSLAKAYAALVPSATTAAIYDIEVSCGTGKQTYTVRSSAPNKAVTGTGSNGGSSGSGSSQTASILALIAPICLEAVLRLFSSL